MGGGGRCCTPPCFPVILASVFSTSLATMLAVLLSYLLCITLDKGSVANECMPCTHSHCLPRGLRVVRVRLDLCMNNKNCGAGTLKHGAFGFERGGLMMRGRGQRHGILLW